MSVQDPLSHRVDALSAVGRRLLSLDASNAYSRLVVDGSSSGNTVAKQMLGAMTSREMIDGPVVSLDDASAMLSAMWLRHDWLDESHRISQRLENPTGSMWHAIMHRREGDFSNSKYWYTQAGKHPALPVIAARSSDAIHSFPADKSIFRIVAHGWNPGAFVDLVEQVHEMPDDPRHKLAVMIQDIEWHVLFEHCTRAASGK